jgi:hypothetical protein
MFADAKGKAIMDAQIAEIAKSMSDPTAIGTPVLVDIVPNADGGIVAHAKTTTGYLITPDTKESTDG